jgi:hypothetical protein
MAHYAEVTDGAVTRVLVVHNDVTTIDDVEVEQRGIDFLDDLFPGSGTWVQTSYNSTIRHNYAGPGHTWDGTGFAAPRPYPSWTLDDDYLWQPPTPMPDDGGSYSWDEASTSWVEDES